MTRSLDDRLEAAKRILDEADVTFTKGTGLATLGDQLERSLAARANIAHWHELWLARNAAREFLDELEDRIEHDDLVVVQFGTPRRSAPSTRIRYSHARLIGVEAYLSLTWSLADHISGFVGRVLCSAQGGAFNEQQSSKLVSHCIDDDIRTKNTAGLLFDSIRQTFGWPIAISYSIRNHFIHDGGQQQEVEFFAGAKPIDKFRISLKGWKCICSRAQRYKVSPGYVRRSANWPSAPEDDLRVVLSVCEREMDDALGILLGSACAALATHLSFMLGND